MTPSDDEPVEDTTAPVPADCGHLQWQMNCERCFYEMSNLASNNIKAASIESVAEGAILFNWHVLMVLKDMEVQLLPYTRSLDLHTNAAAKLQMSNLKKLGVYFVQVVQQPESLARVLEESRVIAEAMVKQQRATTGEAQGTEAQTSGLILTDGG